MHYPERTGLNTAQICIQGKELMDMYVFLKKREHELNPSLRNVLRGAEQILYEYLSIDEIEKLQQ